MSTFHKTGLGILLLAAFAGASGCVAEPAGSNSVEEASADVATAFVSDLSPFQQQQIEVLYRVVSNAQQRIDSMLAQTSGRGGGFEDEPAAQRALIAASSQLVASRTYATRLQEIGIGIRSPTEFGFNFTLTCSSAAVALGYVTQARFAALSPPIPPPPPPPTLAAFGPEIGAVETVLQGLRGPPPTGASCP